MQTTELIKKAEELLRKCSEGPWRWGSGETTFGSKEPEEFDERNTLESSDHPINEAVVVQRTDRCKIIFSLDDPAENEMDKHFIVFARNHMQEITDRMKRYEEALTLISRRFNFGPGVISGPTPAELQLDLYQKLAGKALEEE